MATRANPSRNIWTDEKFVIYKDECKEWLNKIEVEKTWENFETHFIDV